MCGNFTTGVKLRSVVEFHIKKEEKGHRIEVRLETVPTSERFWTTGCLGSLPIDASF